MKYIPAIHELGPPDDEGDCHQIEAVRAYFQGLQMKPAPKTAKKSSTTGTNTIIVNRLNPKWVNEYFDGVYIQLVMMKPFTWWPVVIGQHREEDELAPESLVVKQVYLKYPQNDSDYCLTKGMASCLFYCGEKVAAEELSRLGSQFVYMTKPVAVEKLRERMKVLLPCIGDCEILSKNAKRKKNGNKKGMSITDLIETKTSFPTLVIPHGEDGSNNHAIVVIDDLIFDSTQTYALKLCRESLDWICGPGGMASIDVAIRFNRRSHKKLEPFGHKATTNW